MNDLDQDPRLEARIRETLEQVAAATPIDDAPLRAVERRPSARRRLPAAAAAVALVAGAVTLTMQAGRSDGPAQVPAAAPGGELPAAFEPSAATPLFSADGGPDVVATEYLYSRLPDMPRPGVVVEEPTMEGEAAEVRWSTGDDSGVITAGSIHLRQVADRWAVVAATTDGLDLSDLSYDGERVHGTIVTTDENSLFADVLDWRGEPVHRAPNPDGQEGAGYRFGTAAGPGDGRLEIDVANPGAPTVVRVHHVGGTLLSVAEVRFDPPPLEGHSDLEACVAAGNTTEKEPTPDIVQRACADSLLGDVIASGHAGDRTWELVASDEPSGHWVTLRSRDQVGIFRLRSDKPTFSPGSPPYLQIGPCCGLGDHVAVVAALAPDVDALRVTVGGRVHESATVADPRDPSLRYAVVAVPLAETDEQATVEGLRLERWMPLISDLSLAVFGG